MERQLVHADEYIVYQYGQVLTIKDELPKAINYCRRNKFYYPNMRIFRRSEGTEVEIPFDLIPGENL